jgi:hypothetical protein
MIRLAAALAAVCTVFAPPLRAPGSETIAPLNVIRLFNGTNFSGLYTFLKETKREDPRGIFSVTNGMIRVTGLGLGYLATTEEFKDFELTVEFKWGKAVGRWREGRARDSGIFLHATGPDGNSHDGNGAFMAAIECNLFQGATGDILLIRGNDRGGKLIAPRITAFVSEEHDREGWPWCRSSGRRQTIERWGRLNWIHKSRDWRDELDFRGALDVEKPSGEWNEVRCVCAGDTIRIFVNGQLVNMVREVWPSSGRILLQCEGSEIFFRRFEVRPARRAAETR